MTLDLDDEEADVLRLMTNEGIAKYEMPQYGDLYADEVAIARRLLAKVINSGISKKEDYKL